LPIEHVRDGLEAAMRVRREPGHIVVGIIRVELVEHQERIHLQAPLAAQTAAQFDPGAVGRGDGLDDMD
jgi:hypothetical protein